MAYNKLEARGWVVENVINRTNRAINGDLVLRGIPITKVSLEEDPLPKAVLQVKKKFMNQGLEGEVVTFSAESRKTTPIGIQLRIPGRESEFSDSIGLYIPSEKDLKFGENLELALAEINRRVAEATGHIYASSRLKREDRLNMKGEILVFDSKLFDYWKQNGAIPEYSPRKESSFTHEDKIKMRERNQRFFAELLENVFKGLEIMGKHGIRPRDLLDKNAPIKKIPGDGVAVNSKIFVMAEHALLRPLINERDNGICMAPNTAHLEGMSSKDILHLNELPTCGESLVDNYGGAIGPLYHTIVPNRKVVELNHIFTQGDTIALIARAIFAGIIPAEIYTAPDKLLDFLPCIDLRSIVSEKSDMFEKAPATDLIRVFVPAVEYAIQAVNSLGNLVSVSRICHRGGETGGYHADMHNGSLPKLMAAINRGQDVVPMTETAFAGWKAERMKAVLEDKYEFPLKPTDDVIECIRHARAIVSAVANKPYVDPDAQRILSRMNRRRTADFLYERFHVKAASLRRELEVLEYMGGGERDIATVTRRILEMDRIYNEIEEEAHVQVTGITGRKLLKKLGLDPIDIKEKRTKKEKTKKVVRKKK